MKTLKITSNPYKMQLQLLYMEDENILCKRDENGFLAYRIEKLNKEFKPDMH